MRSSRQAAPSKYFLAFAVIAGLLLAASASAESYKCVSDIKFISNARWIRVQLNQERVSGNPEKIVGLCRLSQEQKWLRECAVANRGSGCTKACMPKLTACVKECFTNSGAYKKGGEEKKFGATLEKIQAGKEYGVTDAVKKACSTYGEDGLKRPFQNANENSPCKRYERWVRTNCTDYQRANQYDGCPPQIPVCP